MGRLNALLLIGFVIHVAMLLYTMQFDEEWVAIVEGIFLGGVALNGVGLAIILAGEVRGGATVFIIGCIAFVPIGVVGWIGARNMLDKLAEERMARRRAEFEE